MKMNAIENANKRQLLLFVTNLSEEQANKIIRSLPELIALIEEPTELCLQESFQPAG